MTQRVHAYNLSTAVTKEGRSRAQSQPTLQEQELASEEQGRAEEDGLAFAVPPRDSCLRTSSHLGGGEK